MAKKRTKKYDPNLVEALKKLAFPIVDKRHNLIVYLDDERARSNQTRLEHIAKCGHDLTVKDIEAIPDGITKYSKLKKERNRKDSFNYYFPRKGQEMSYIQISVKIDKNDRRIAKIKTVFVARRVKRN